MRRPCAWRASPLPGSKRAALERSRSRDARGRRAGARHLARAVQALDQGPRQFAGQRGRYRGQRSAAHTAPRARARRRLAVGGNRRQPARPRQQPRNLATAWIVDPIDGTRAYISGRADWTISVALVDDGRPVLAALYAPVTDEMFMALRGAKARRATAPASRRTAARRLNAPSSPDPNAISTNCPA